MPFGVINFCYAQDEVLAGQFYEKAIVEYRNGNNRAAILELKNALQQNPKYLSAQILLAEVSLQDKNLIGTEVAISQADKLGADPSLLIKTRAQLYLYQLKYQKLIEEIIPRQFSHNIQADLHLYRGQAYLQLNQLTYALTEFNSVLAMQPSHVEALAGKANALIKMGDLSAAKTAAEQVRDIQPDSAESWYLKAVIEHSLGHLKEALAGYSAAVKKKPDEINSRFARASVLMDLKKDDLAEVDLAVLRKAHPNNIRVAYLYYVVLARNNKQLEAKQSLLDAAEVLSKISAEFINGHPQTLLLAGLINYNLNKFQKSMPYLKLYSEKHPNKPELYRMMASILLAEGEGKKVIELLKPVQHVISNDYRSLIMLGKAYMKNGQYDRANRQLEKVIALDINNMEVHTELGIARLAMGLDESAAKHLNIAFNTDSLNTKAGIPLTILYMKQQKLHKAEAIAKKMQQHSPENASLLNLLGAVQARLEKTKLARKTFETVIEKNPDFISGYINLSKLDASENNFDVANQRIIGLIEQYPEKLDLYVELARFYQAEGENAIALKWLNKVLKKSPEFLDAKLALIELKLKMKIYPEALALALEAKEMARDNMQVLELLTQSFIANKKYPKAKWMLKKMSGIAGFNAQKLTQVAHFQVSVADYSSAIESLKKAVVGNEYYIPARVMLADVELQHGKVIFARNHTDYLLKYYPDHSEGYRLQGDIAQKTGDLGQALQSYRMAFAKEKNTYLLMKLYHSLSQASEEQKAFQLLKQWVDQHQNDALPVQALAEEYLIRGQLKQSQKYYEQLIQQFKKRPDLLNNLAYIYFNSGDERALEFAEQAQQLAPELPSINDTLGWILVNKGQAERGLHYLRSAHARAAGDAEIIYHIGVALNQLKRYDEAKAELKQALKMSDEFAGKKQAKALLEVLEKQ